MEKMSQLVNVPLGPVQYKNRLRNEIRTRLGMFDVTPPESESANWFFFASRRGQNPREATSVRVLGDRSLSISSEEDQRINIVEVFYSLRTLSGTVLAVRARRSLYEFIEGDGEIFRDISARDVRLPRLRNYVCAVIEEVDAAAYAAARR